MDYDKEIAKLQHQINVIREKQKKELEELNKFHTGDLYMAHGIKTLVKIFHLHSDVWGYIFNDGSGRTFNSKIEFVHYMNGNFTYVGKAKYFSVKE